MIKKTVIILILLLVIRFSTYKCDDCFSTKDPIIWEMCKQQAAITGQPVTEITIVQ
jgi:hypothetical protein